MKLRVTNCPNPKFNWTNRAYVSESKFNELKRLYESKFGKVSETNPPSVNLVLNDKLVFSTWL
jgi:hypothetical protein